MPPIEVVGSIVPVFELVFGQDARITPPHIGWPVHLEAAAERDIGGAIDRQAPLLVHDDTEIIVVEYEFVAVLGRDQRSCYRLERAVKLRKRHAEGASPEEIRNVSFPFRIVRIERRIYFGRLAPAPAAFISNRTMFLPPSPACCRARIRVPSAMDLEP